MKIILSLLFVCSIIFLIGCSERNQLSVSELMQYWRDESNGLYKKNEQGGITLELAYRPKDLVLAQEIEGSNFSKEQIDSIQLKLKDVDYFILKLSKDEKDLINFLANDPVRFNQAIEYLSFQIGKDIKMLYGENRIDAEDFMYSRTFGSTNSSSILLAFKSSIHEKSGEVTVFFDDSFFGSGLNRFDFKISDIKSIPSLDLNYLTL